MPSECSGPQAEFETVHSFISHLRGLLGEALGEAEVPHWGQKCPHGHPVTVADLRVRRAPACA
jgi:hypothetical protein